MTDVQLAELFHLVQHARFLAMRHVARVVVFALPLLLDE